MDAVGTPKSRTTRQRLIILEALRATKSHPTAEELHETVRRRMPRISLGTVYRNLELLSETGVILRLDSPGGRRRYDANVAEKHYHIRCVSCDRVGDLPKSIVKRLDFRLDGSSDYEILGHSLAFSGLCPDCRQVTADPGP